MKRIGMLAAAVTLGLAGLANAASVTYSGAALSGLDYINNGGTATYYPAGGYNPVAEANLYTADSGTTGGSPAVFVLGQMGTLDNFTASYVLGYSSVPNGTAPYWNIRVSPDANPADVVHIISMGGTPLDGSSPIHAYNSDYSAPVGTWGMTLSALGALSFDGYTIGDMTVRAAGIEIGEWDNGGQTVPAFANITSITVPASVPLPSAAWGGLALLGVMGAMGGTKRLRKQPA